MADRTSTLSRVCNAPQQAVFDAWTDPAEIRRFWTADPDWTISAVEVDARRGGSYRVEFGPPGGTPLVERGQFLAFDPPHALTYSEQVTQDGTVMHGPTPCAVRFREIDGERTEVSVTWTLEPGEPDDGRIQGWTAQLDLFAALFAAR